MCFYLFSDYAVIQFIVVLSSSDSSAENLDSKTESELEGSSLLAKSKSLPGATPNIASGKEVVKRLQNKLKADSELLSLQLVSLDTLVCQNECSGHGTCHQATRTCICEPFWIENLVGRQLMDGKSNCGMH